MELVIRGMIDGSHPTRLAWRLGWYSERTVKADLVLTVSDREMTASMLIEAPLDSWLAELLELMTREQGEVCLTDDDNSSHIFFKVFPDREKTAGPARGQVAVCGKIVNYIATRDEDYLAERFRDPVAKEIGRVLRPCLGIGILFQGLLVDRQEITAFAEGFLNFLHSSEPWIAAP